MALPQYATEEEKREAERRRRQAEQAAQEQADRYASGDAYQNNGPDAGAAGQVQTPGGSGGTQGPAAQRGYDPRFDDPDYGKEDKGGRDKPSEDRTMQSVISDTWRNTWDSLSDKTKDQEERARLAQLEAGGGGFSWQDSRFNPANWGQNNQDQEQDRGASPSNPAFSWMYAENNPALRAAQQQDYQQQQTDFRNQGEEDMRERRRAGIESPSQERFADPVRDYYEQSSGYARAQAYDEKRDARTQQLQEEGAGFAPQFLNNVRNVAGVAFDYGLNMPWEMVKDQPFKSNIIAPGEEMSVGQVASALGATANQILNQTRVNPNALDLTQYQDTMFDQEGNYRPGWIMDVVKQTWESNLNQQLEARNYLDSLSPSQRQEARMFESLYSSGGKAVQDATQEFLNRDALIANHTEEAQRAYARGDADSAAYHGAEAERLKNTTPVDILEMHENPWAELVGGMVLDPLNVVGPISALIGVTPEALRTAKTVDKVLNVDPQRAAQVWDDAWKSAQEAVRVFDQGTSSTERVLEAVVDPISWMFERTPEAKALLANDVLDMTISSLAANLNSVDQARAMINGLADGSIIDGIRAGGANVPVGLGALTNEDFLEALPILQYALREIGGADGLRSLADGVENLNKLDLSAELNGIFYNAGKRFFGRSLLDESVPLAAQNVTWKSTGNGVAELTYLDGAGEEVGKLTDLTVQQAKQMYNEFKRQGLPAPIATAKNLVKLPAQIQKSFMTANYLIMRPANWIRNALNAGATLGADGANSWKTVDEVIGYLGTKYGGAMPTTRMTNIATDIGQTSQGAGREAGTAGRSATNQISRWYEKVSNIPYGRTEIGKLPVGEEAFYSRGYYTQFKRFFDTQWRNQMKQLGPRFQELGIDPKDAQAIVGKLTDLGVNGSQADVLAKMDDFLRGVTPAFSLEASGIPNVFDATFASRIDDIITSAASPEEAAQALRSALREANPRVGNAEAISHGEPGRHLFTQREVLEDASDIMRVGGDEQVARSLIEAEQAVSQNIIADAQDSGAVQVAMDFWRRTKSLRDKTRREQNELQDVAKQILTGISDPVERQRVFDQLAQDTSQLWSRYIEQLQSLGDDVRIAITNPDAGWDLEPINPLSVIEDYMGWDADEFNRIREAIPESTWTDPIMDRKIQAARNYTDQSLNRAYAAAVESNDPSALDLLISAEVDVENVSLAAKGWIKNAQPSPEAPPAAWQAWREQANNTWNKVWDYAYGRYEVARRQIGTGAAAAQTDSGLRWVDDAGNAHRLVDRTEDGRWMAMNEATGKMEVATPPANVIEDFTSLGGNAAPIMQDYDLNDLRRFAYMAGVSDAPKRKVSQTTWAGNTPLPEGPATGVAQDIIDEFSSPRLSEFEEAQQRAWALGATDVPEEFISGTPRPAPASKPAQSATQEAAAYTDNYLKNVLRSELGYEIKSLDELTPQQINDAVGYMATRAMDEGDVDFADIQKAMDWRRQNPTAINNPHYRSDFIPTGEDGDLMDLVASYDKMRAAGGYNPTIGDISAYQWKAQRDALEELIGQLPGIMGGNMSGRLTNSQILRIKDMLRTDVMRSFDDVLTGASRVAKEAADFAMLNYADRRNFDTLLSLVTPYHFFWSRQPQNWMRRVMARPDLINHMGRAYRGIEAENQQSLGANAPQRLRGTMPNPLHPYGLGQERMANPITYILPMQYVNQFASPEQANNNYEYFMENWKMLTPGLFPLYEYAAKAAFDRAYPLEDGSKRTDTYNIGSLVPTYRLLGYAGQALGLWGNQNAAPNFLQYGDQYDTYRSQRAAGEAAVTSEDPNIQGYAMQVLNNRAEGRDELAGVPEEYRESAVAAADQSDVAAARDRLGGAPGVGFFTGIPTYNYNPAEQQALQTSNQYRGYGFDEQGNQAGSQEAQLNLLEENDWLGAWWAKGQEGMEPAERMQTGQYWDQYKAISDQQVKEVEAFLAQNPGADYEDIAEIRDKYSQQKDALKEKYPLADLEGSKSLYKSSMNPYERAEDIAFKTIFSSKPEWDYGEYPGDNASNKAKREYYQKKGEWENEYLDSIEQKLGSIVDSVYGPDAFKGSRRHGINPEIDMATYEGVAQATMGSYADDLLSGARLRYAGVLETEWAEQNRLQGELNQMTYEQRNAWYAAQDQRVAEQFGQEGLQKFYQYKAADDETRAQMREADPQYSEINLAYYDQAAHDEATALFGDDIFQQAATYPGGGTKEEKAKWREENADVKDNVYAYFAWNRERREGQGDTGAPVYANYPEFAQAPDWMTYQGERPVGSDRDVIGGGPPPEDFAPWYPYQSDQPLPQATPNDMGIWTPGQLQRLMGDTNAVYSEDPGYNAPPDIASRDRMDVQEGRETGMTSAEWLADMQAAAFNNTTGKTSPADKGPAAGGGGGGWGGGGWGGGGWGSALRYSQPNIRNWQLDRDLEVQPGGLTMWRNTEWRGPQLRSPSGKILRNFR